MIIGDILLVSLAVYYCICCSLICTSLCTDEYNSRQTPEIEYEDLPTASIRLETIREESVSEEERDHLTALERELFSSQNNRPMETLSDII